MPKIVFSAKAYRKIKYVVDKVNKEVGFVGSVTHVDDPDNSLHFRVEDIWVPKQKSNSGTCDISGEGRALLLEEIMASAPNPDEGMRIANTIRFWGHSHVNMAVFASAQDDAQMKDFETCEYYIRAIFNKKGEINLCLYHFDDDVLYSELVPVVELVDSDEAKLLDDQINNNVGEETYTYEWGSGKKGKGKKSYYGSSYYGDYYGDYYDGYYGSSSAEQEYDENGLDSFVCLNKSKEYCGWYRDETGKLIRKRMSKEEYIKYSKILMPEVEESKETDTSIKSIKKLDPITGEVISEEVVDKKEEKEESKESKGAKGSDDQESGKFLFNKDTQEFELV